MVVVGGNLFFGMIAMVVMAGFAETFLAMEYQKVQPERIERRDEHPSDNGSIGKPGARQVR